MLPWFIISNEVEDTLALLSADDVSCALDIFNLQQQLNVTYRYCNAVGIKLNLDKTGIVFFRNGGILRKNDK